jgi:hypothetical protein
MSDGLDILRDRGVSDEVREARKYRRYEAGAGPVELPELADHTRYLKTYAGPCGGWLMPKYPVFDDLEPIRPQLRPDRAIEHESWVHRHRDMPGHELKAHLASEKRVAQHDGIGLDDEHEHPVTSKYVLGPRRDGTADDSARLDCHPLTDFRKSGRVFFVIEGTPKNDALVSCGEKSFDVPSVAQWDAPELPRFAHKYLLEDPVFIIPDSDWVDNSEVIFHAVCCREYLRRLGVAAEIASPPPRAEPDAGGSFKQGVDDFLGPKGSPLGRRSPDQLLVLRREVDEDAFAAFWEDYVRARTKRSTRGPYAKTLKLDEAVARMLVLASHDKRTLRGVEALTKAIIGEPRERYRPTSEERRERMTKLAAMDTDERAEAEWRPENYRVFNALRRLYQEGAYTLTGDFPAWTRAGWKRVKGDKFIRTQAGIRQPIPEIELHSNLRLAELPPIEIAKMQAEEVAQ